MVEVQKEIARIMKNSNKDEQERSFSELNFLKSIPVIDEPNKIKQLDIIAC